MTNADALQKILRDTLGECTIPMDIETVHLLHTIVNDLRELEEYRKLGTVAHLKRLRPNIPERFTQGPYICPPVPLGSRVYVVKRFCSLPIDCGVPGPCRLCPDYKLEIQPAYFSFDMLEDWGITVFQTEKAAIAGRAEIEAMEAKERGEDWHPSNR